MAHLDEGAFDALATARDGAGILAVWSQPRGTFVRALDDQGKPRADAVRVGERCRGGVALAPGADATHWLACLRPEREAALGRVSALGSRGEWQTLGPAGRDSEGIAAGVAGDRVHVAYHDGTPGAYGVYLVSVAGRRAEQRRRLSDVAYAATAPSLTMADGRWIASWAETRFDGEGESATRIALQREDSPVRTLGETPLDRPDARLVWGADGPWLGFRSRRSRDRHPQLYVAKLDANLNPRGKPVRVGRANTLAPPVVQECGGQRFAHMSRLYGGERYVALYPLDAQLRSLGGGYQYYENGHDYDRIALTCGSDGPLLLTAERPKGDSGTRLTAAVLQCPDVVEPHGCSFPCTSR